MTSENSSLATIEHREWTLPDPTATRDQLTAIRAFQQACQTHLMKDHDYGTIPGTQKPTLLKPGAEKIIRLLGLADEYDILEDVKDWDKGFFHVQVKCRLIHLATGTLVTTGLGECNSMESRYRWRWVWERELPEGYVKQGAIYRTTRNGGKQYRLENEDIYSQFNTILKMGKKRSLVDAALSAGRLSELFTQDMEDLAGTGVIEHEEATERPAQGQRQTQRQSAPARGSLGTCEEHQKAWGRSNGKICHPIPGGGWCYKDEEESQAATVVGGMVEQNVDTWNHDHPDQPITEDHLLKACFDLYNVAEDTPTDSLAALEPDQTLELAGLIANGQFFERLEQVGT